MTAFRLLAHETQFHRRCLVVKVAGAAVTAFKANCSIYHRVSYGLARCNRSSRQTTVAHRSIAPGLTETRRLVSHHRRLLAMTTRPTFLVAAGDIGQCHKTLSTNCRESSSPYRRLQPNMLRYSLHARA
jgi:hypothetical protein